MSLSATVWPIDVFLDNNRALNHRGIRYIMLHRQYLLLKLILCWFWLSLKYDQTYLLNKT